MSHLRRALQLGKFRKLIPLKGSGYCVGVMRLVGFLGAVIKFKQGRYCRGLNNYQHHF